MATFAPIKKEEHQNLTVASRRGLAGIANQHIVSATAREYMQLATSYPIFLIKDQERFRSVIMLGLEAGENLYYQNDKMNALSIPQVIALAPFGLGLDTEKENTLTACVDVDSEFVGEGHDNALFDAAGNETEFLKSIQEQLGRLYENEVMTEKFIKELQDNDLIHELELSINHAEGENKRLVGIYGINEEKLQALSDEKVLDFQKRGLFIPIHAMMVSMGQINRLVQLRNEHTDKKVAGIQIRPKQDEQK